MFNSIKTKIALTIFAVFIFFVGLVLWLNHWLIIDYVKQFEVEDLTKNAKRCINSLQMEGAHLDQICADWAFFDDLHNYMETRDPEFIKSNFGENNETFKTLKVNFVYIFDTNKKLVWGRSFYLFPFRPMKLKMFSLDSLKKKNIFHLTSEISSIGGIFNTEVGPMIVSARPILTSNNTGPIRGTIVFGRLVTPNFVHRVQEQIELKFKIEPIDGIEIRNAEQFKALAMKFKPIDNSKIITEADFSGWPGHNFRISFIKDRQIFSKGMKFRNLLSLSGLVTFFILLHVVLIVFKVFIHKPLKEVSDHMKKIGDSAGKNLEPFADLSKDEIGILKSEFNLMLNNIKEGRKQIRKSEEQFRLLFEKMLSAAVVFEKNEDGVRIVDSNTAFSVYLGIENKDESNLELFKVLSRKINNLNTKVDEVLSEGVPFTFEWSDDETKRNFHCLLFKLIKNKACMIFWDTTFQLRAMQERLELERKLEQAHKLESLGVLAGGVAHDFNNIIMGIIGTIGICKEDIEKTPGLSEHLENIEKASFKAADITRKMLAYTGKSFLDKQKLNLSSHVEAFVNEFNGQLTSNIRLESIIEKSDLPIKVDQNQLKIILRNVFTNSVEAIGFEKDGKIIVTVSLRHCPEDFINRYWMFPGTTEGEYACVRVEDNGCGMTEDVLEKVFEPFFSTKFTGRGLNMASVQGILRAHNGFIIIKSEKGKGTIVELFFPIFNEDN